MGIFDNPNPDFYKKPKGFVLKNKEKTKQYRFEPLKKEGIFKPPKYDVFMTDASKAAGPKKFGKKSSIRVKVKSDN